MSVMPAQSPIIISHYEDEAGRVNITYRLLVDGEELTGTVEDRDRTPIEERQDYDFMASFLKSVPDDLKIPDVSKPEPKPDPVSPTRESEIGDARFELLAIKPFTSPQGLKKTKVVWRCLVTVGEYVAFCHGDEFFAQNGMTEQNYLDLVMCRLEPIKDEIIETAIKSVLAA